MNHQLGQLCEDLAKAAVQQMFLAKNKELQSWRDEARRPTGAWEVKNWGWQP